LSTGILSGRILPGRRGPARILRHSSRCKGKRTNESKNETHLHRGTPQVAMRRNSISTP
jgi:hypothetical protein